MSKSLLNVLAFTLKLFYSVPPSSSEESDDDNEGGETQMDTIKLESLFTDDNSVVATPKISSTIDQKKVNEKRISVRNILSSIH